MATDKWIEYNGVELVNLSRTAQLAQTLGIDVVWVAPEYVQWVEDALGGTDYDDITEAPWYDSGYPASSEFAGIIPMSIPALDDSTLESSVVEYITNGGNSGRSRNATLPIVASLTIIASTDRGAQFGKRWLDRRLKETGTRAFCSGVDLRLFAYDEQNNAGSPPQIHFRNVRLTRGASVTRKRSTDCATVWWINVTLTANDPFIYGDPVLAVEGLGIEPSGPGLIADGIVVLTELECPVYDYSPIYDPRYPALVPPPVPPDFYPAGWDVVPGMTFERYWAQVTAPEPSSLDVVPIITLSSDTEARMVRVSIWEEQSSYDSQCDPLFSVMVTYIPPDVQFIIDGEREASYVWDGVSPAVRRTDSLVYAPDARPVDWSKFNDPDSLFITLDLFSGSSGELAPFGAVEVKVELVPKSD